MRIKEFMAVSACKLTIKLLRRMGRGGTALPGRVALKLCPDILSYLAKNVKCVVITLSC